MQELVTSCPTSSAKTEWLVGVRPLTFIYLVLTFSCMFEGSGRKRSMKVRVMGESVAE